MEAALYLAGLFDRPALVDLLEKLREYGIEESSDAIHTASPALVPFPGPREAELRITDLRTLQEYIRHLGALAFSGRITEANADGGSGLDTVSG